LETNYALVRLRFAESVKSILNQLRNPKITNRICGVPIADQRCITHVAKKPRQYNQSEVASSMSEEDDDDTSNSDVGDVDDVSDVCAIDNPNSTTCKLNTTLSKLDEFSHADEKVETTEINRRLGKLEKCYRNHT